MEPGALSVSTPAPDRQRRYIVSIAILALLLAVILVTIAFNTPWRENLISAWTAFTLPDELKHAEFVSQTTNGTGIYVATRFGFKEVQTLSTGSALESLSRTGDSLYAIARMESGSELIVNGESRAALAPSSSAVAGSPDAERIAFMSPVASTTRLQPPILTAAPLYTPPIAPVAWTLSIFYPHSKRILPAGPGAGPLFVDNTHLLRLISNGILISDLTDSSKIVFKEGKMDLAALPVLSPDHTHFATREFPGGSVVIYKVSASSIEKIATLPSMGNFALGNSALYELRPINSKSNSVTEIIVYPLDGTTAGKRIAVFPFGFHLTKLLL